MDATLEVDLRAAEDAIDAYLRDPSPSRRDALLAALEQLDQQIDLSDDYESRITGSAAVGYRLQRIGDRRDQRRIRRPRRFRSRSSSHRRS